MEYVLLNVREWLAAEPGIHELRMPRTSSSFMIRPLAVDRGASSRASDGAVDNIYNIC
jgi:hypothetical protein